MNCQGIRNTWVVSSAISIRNNWDLVLKNYGISYVFVEKLKDLEQIRKGDFVIITLNKISQYQKQVSKWLKQHRQKIQLVLDESDEISNARSQRTKAVLACFRRCRMKLLTTGTSTRNNISEFAPQLELLYNNSCLLYTSHGRRTLPHKAAILAKAKRIRRLGSPAIYHKTRLVTDIGFSHSVRGQAYL